MSTSLCPGSAQELAERLAAAAAAKQKIELLGAGSKKPLGGRHAAPDIAISTAKLNRILEYEPNDLTIGVEAGVKWADLQRTLAEHQQMIPLDPAWFDQATAGGVVAANTCGPRRRLYGSARDHVIGMHFVTLDGKTVKTGGMVVKNVAGLDMAKLMIGSFGTLAAIVRVNFKLSPLPPVSRTFLLSSPTLERAIEQRNAILAGVLQPASIDLLNPQAAARLSLARLSLEGLSLEGWVLAMQVGGSRKLIDRYTRELPSSKYVDGPVETSLWRAVREFVPAFLAEHPDGAVVRVSTVLQGVASVAEHCPVPLLTRAGNGVSYACFPDCQAAAAWLKQGVGRGWKGIIESVPPLACSAEEQWPQPGNDLVVMGKIKRMLDPENLLNAGRLYGRL
ncbi:MAG: FAD-binding oxidoreductase [Bryobacterales bacterium]|nr:FAD-binding oxidoreductase [Bryobacterales bacterium]